MALWIDREWVGLADLTAIDSEVPSIAEAEEITVEGLGGVAREAFAECSNWLMTSFPSLSGAYDPVSDVGRTVYNRFRLEQVVITEEYGERRTPLRDWLIWSTLAAFYRSAVRRSLSDRYERKLELADGELRKRQAAVRRHGIPIVFNPLPSPGAPGAPWAGSVSPVTATAVSNGSYSGATTVYYAVSFVSNGVESARSVVAAIDLASGESFTLTPTSLDPPNLVNGYLHPTGWNAYTGATADDLRLATVTPKTFGQSLSDGRYISNTRAVLRNGQAPDSVVSYRDLILRG